MCWMVPIFVDPHEPTVDYEEVEHFEYAFAQPCPVIR